MKNLLKLLPITLFVGGTFGSLLIPPQPPAYANSPRPIATSPANPMTAEDWFRQALQKQSKGDYQGAIADYTQVLKLVPDSNGAYYNRGLTYAGLGNHTSAVMDYDQTIKLQPNYPDAYYSRGSSYSSLGDHKSAIANYLECCVFMIY
jgi:tetratricopeptide (TPR) repeat protein